MNLKFVGGMTEGKVLEVDDFFDLVQNRTTTENNEIGIYKKVAWAYRALTIRADAVAGVPWGVYKKGADDENPQFDYEDPKDWPMGDWLWTMEAALTMYGGSPWAVVGNRIFQGIEYMNPSITNIILNPAKTEIASYEVGTGKGKQNFDADNVAFLRYWHPTDDLTWGVAPMSVALSSGKLVANANDWASSFFKNGAIPLMILETEQAVTDPNEINRLKRAWRTMLRGVERAFETVVLQSGLKAHPVTPPVNELAMPELMEEQRKQVATAMSIPQTMLEDAANYATAKEHDVQFVTRFLKPECIRIASQLNHKMFKRYGLELRFHFDRIEALQRDENEKAQGAARMIEALNLMKSARAITAQEYRERASTLLMQMEMEPLSDELPEELEQQPQQVPPPNTFDQQRQDARQELRKWQTKAMRSFKEGNGADVTFVSDVLEPVVAGVIEGGLELAQSEDDIAKVFERAAMWEGYA